MAAYAALVSLAQTIDQILNHDSNSLSLHQKQQIVSIHEYVIFLQTFLEHFPEKADNILEGRIRDATNQTEDSIEYLILKQSQLRSAAAASSSSRFAPMAGSEDNESRIKLEGSLKQLIMEIDSIVEEVMGIKNSLGNERVRLSDEDSPPPAASSSSRLISPSSGKDVMVGFDGDLTAIKERLCGQSSKLQVIPVVGMGGIGKTTLALNAYDDPLISEHFLIRAWATVSQDYSAQKILSNLLLFMKEFLTEKLDKVNNEEKVHKILKGRKYLIVMDDIWSTDAWDDVRRIFPDDNNGSRILLTTRLTHVAAYVDSSSHLHEMQLMNWDRSWDLLREKVFKQQPCPPELEDIGKEIAGSCEGLPLSIVVVAGFLSTVSKTPTLWKEIAENVNSVVAAEDGRFEKILSLSYAHLPHHLRPCFLYMGAFPEDYEILVSKLIKLWVSEGFLRCPNGSKSLEEAAEEYVEDLVKRSLVFVSKRKSDGKIKSCRLHDMMRELCIRKAHQEKFLVHITDRRVPKESLKNQRRVCTIRQKLDCLKNSYGSTIRTVLKFQEDVLSQDDLEYFKFVKVLDFIDAGSEFDLHAQPGNQDIFSIPDRVFELFHLRYLAFFSRNISYFSIPAAISNLQNLQTLVIHPNRGRWAPTHRVSLPLEIWNMTQLKHLVCYQFDGLPNPKKGAITCGLENMQTLTTVTNLKCSKSMMRMIPNIKKLGIHYTSDKHYHHLKNLVHLQHLEKLKITDQVYNDAWVIKNANLTFPKTLKKLVAFPKKLKKLAFPESLKKLSLGGYNLPWDKMMKIVGSLPNLQVLKLTESHPDWTQWETSEGEFPQLKYMLIGRSYLEEWISESSHFPKLEYLLLYYCGFLQEIPDGIGEIPTLKLIKVYNCLKSVESSAIRIKKEQQSYENDALQVRCRGCYYNHYI